MKVGTRFKYLGDYWFYVGTLYDKYLKAERHCIAKPGFGHTYSPSEWEQVIAKTRRLT